MIELNRHIEILLLDNDCVIIPDFGGFLTHYVSANYDESENLFLPPSRTVGFNPQLKLNDHLLVQSYVEAYDISYPEALRRIENEVEELRQYLDNNGYYELNGLGTLSVNSEGNYEFEPCAAGLLTPVLYGLSSFEMTPADSLSSTLQKDSKIIPFEESEAISKLVNFSNNEDTTEEAEDRSQELTLDADNDNNIVIRMSWIRNIVATAAVFLLFFISTPIKNGDMQIDRQESCFLPVESLNSSTDSIEMIVLPAINDSIASVVKDSVVSEQPIEKELDVKQDEITNETAKQDEISKQETKEVVKSTSYYTICLASQTLRHLAEPFLESLNKAGIKDASIVDMENMNKVRVVCGTFSTEAEAQTALRQNRALHEAFEDGWVLHVKE